MNISDVMKPSDVLIDVSVASKPKLLKFVAENAAATVGIAAETILHALRSRENLGSTGIGSGIAIPHAPVTGLASPFALLVRLAKPIDFDSIDDQPVDLVCLILTPPGEQNRYLKLLSKIARQLQSADTLKTIRQAPNHKLVYDALTEQDSCP